MLMIQKGYDKVKFKDGTIRDITEASDNLNISALAKTSHEILFICHILGF